jgi:hypothetical protein
MTPIWRPSSAISATETLRRIQSYIVRSVHDMLRTEFGLKDGLADTTTWGEMSRRSDDLKIPEGTSPDQSFVQVLDPAAGTGTFLVEVIEVIHATLVGKWKAQHHSEKKILELWNEYVPKFLLPRLHGYELLMAAYAIAHLKIGLKLYETGYRFGSNERARIYLTNTLEPTSNLGQMKLEGFLPALADEAQAVNAIKRDQRFTVVIGNPPYSKISSNLTPEMRATVERYRYLDGERIRERGALQFEINLQDDYVKFFRFCEERISASNVGLLGLITNSGYLSTPTLRGMRDSLLDTFRSLWVLDLHGHLARGEIGSDGAQEENVFDIVQGVSLFLGCRRLPKTRDGSVFHAERYGSRAGKYSFLQSNSRTTTGFAEIEPSAPFYLFVPHDADLAQEWKQYIGLAELFPRNSAGIITARDGLVIAESKRELAERLERFSHAKGADASVYDEFGFSASKRFELRGAQSELRRLKSFSEPIRRMLHRPFDERFIFFHPSVVWSLSRPMANQMNDGKNLALVATRQVTRPQFEHAFVTRNIIEIKACSHDRNTQIFPLFIRPNKDELALASVSSANLNSGVFVRVARGLGLRPNSETRELGKDDELSPLRLFNFCYGVLHSPSYRQRYFEFLRSDFPRLPLTENAKLFRSLAHLGGELVVLHLLESPKLDHFITTYTGPKNPEVKRIAWSDNTVWLDGAATKKGRSATGTIGFQGVRADVWSFHIGGYQVCDKWLKDRKGRTLSKDDIAHYQKIVVALSETIRLMKEVDAVIALHGGWPGAFAGTEKGHPSVAAIEVDAIPSLPFRQPKAPEVEYMTEDVPLRKVAEQKQLFDQAAEETDSTARGRDISDVDRADLMCRIRSMFSDGTERTREDAIVSLARDLGFARTGSRIHDELDNALRTAVRRAIVEGDRGTLRLFARTIDQYERSFLKEQLLASLSGRQWTEREDVIRDFARWMGYARTGSTIDELSRSLITGLLREGRLESDGSRVRRAG